MRTNIVIDDKLMRDTLRATGLKTKREAVEEALRTLLRLRSQAGIRRLRGKLDWQRGLNAVRGGRGSSVIPAGGSDISRGPSPSRPRDSTGCLDNRAWRCAA